MRRGCGVFDRAQQKRPAERRPFPQSETRNDWLVLRNHRAGSTEVEAVVDTGLDGVLVVADAAEAHQLRRRDEAGIAEVVVLVLDLARPVRSEHVFETSPDRPTILMVAVEGEGLRNASEEQVLVVVGEGITALHVEQARTPGVADAAGHRSNAATIVVVDEAVREHGMDGVAAEPGVLSFSTEHPVRRELVIEAALHAAEEARVVVVAD